ncbi:MAG: hypothetical protein ACR2KV_14955 [Solirubrobacteraceae bacterium]
MIAACRAGATRSLGRRVEHRRKVILGSLLAVSGRGEAIKELEEGVEAEKPADDPALHRRAPILGGAIVTGSVPLRGR